MKKIAFVVILVVLVVRMVVPVNAAGWTKRVSGGCSDTVQYDGLSVTLSAWEKSDGSFGGEGQYYYPVNGRTFHLDVTKVCFSADLSTAAAIGTVRGQDGTEITRGGWGGIAVKDGGDSGDGLRVWFDRTEDVMRGWCQTQTSGRASFPATVLDGNFHIRSK